MNNQIKLLLLDVDGVLTDGGIYVNEDGSEFRRFNAKDGMGITRARKAGFEVGFISHSHLPGVIQHRAKVLGINWVYVGKTPKLEVLKQWMAENNWQANEIAFIGDDVNDIEMLQEVGMSACPRDAIDRVKEACDHILSKDGGQGAVREFIDRFLLA